MQNVYKEMNTLHNWNYFIQPSGLSPETKYFLECPGSFRNPSLSSRKFSGRREVYGQTDRIHHRIETSGGPPIRQPAHRLLLAKQAEMNELLKDMKERGETEESDSQSYSSP
jgi:hypothetical protein